MDSMGLLYDKTANIYSVSLTTKKQSSIKIKTLLYENVKCEYFIATRWNVVNYQPNLGVRQQDLDRIDMVIPGSEYNVNKVIEQWYYVEMGNSQYIIDQLEYYRMPNGSLESVYLRLNQKWK
jgi:hypothetical protein